MFYNMKTPLKNTLSKKFGPQVPHGVKAIANSQCLACPAPPLQTGMGGGRPIVDNHEPQIGFCLK